MAKDMNSVIMVGRLCTDAEFKDLGNGRGVTSFRFASNRYGDKTTFIGCDLFQGPPVGDKKGRAQVAADLLKKGEKLIIQGELAMSESEKDGQRRTFYSLDVNNWQFAGGGKGDSKDSGEQEDLSFP